MVSNRAMWLSLLILKHFHNTLNSNPTPINSYFPSPLPTGSESHNPLPALWTCQFETFGINGIVQLVGFVVFFLSLRRSFSNSSMHMSAFDSHLLTNESPRNSYAQFASPLLSDGHLAGCLCFLTVMHNAAISWSPSLRGQMFSLFLTFICTGVELLGHERTPCLTFRGTATCFLN